MNDNQDINRRFAELVGPPLCWHTTIQNHLGNYTCSCGKEFDGMGCFAAQKEHKQVLNPNFIRDPRLVLVEMMKREDWELFMAKLMYGLEQPGVETIDWDHNIDIDHILTVGLLVKAAIEWLEKEEGK